MSRILKPSEWAAIKAIVPKPNSCRIADYYHCNPSGTIMREHKKPMSRRDRIRVEHEPKNRFPIRAPDFNRFCQYESR